MEEMTTFSEALVNTGLGMGTVFVVLILISFLISLLKYVPMLFDNKKKKAAEPAAKADAPVKKAEPVPAPVVEAKSDDAQIVAVIAAAIAAQMTEETGTVVNPDELVIRSIKKRVFSY